MKSECSAIKEKFKKSIHNGAWWKTSIIFSQNKKIGENIKEIGCLKWDKAL